MRSAWPSLEDRISSGPQIDPSKSVDYRDRPWVKTIDLAPQESSLALAIDGILSIPGVNAVGWGAKWTYRAVSPLIKSAGRKALGFADEFLESAKRLLPKAPKECPRVEPKQIIIDGTKHPESARHAQDAIEAGIKPEGVVDRPGARPRRNGRLKDEPVIPGKDRDEFPPAVLNNGQGGHSVRPLSPGDNRGSGSSIGRQLDGVPNGTPVIIKPINVPPRNPS